MSALTKMISSNATIASIKAIHKIVKSHISYGRVWTDKRLTESPTTVYDHRIKYEYCDPSASQLDSINKVLRWKGLRAKRYNVFNDYRCRAQIKSLIIEKLTTEQQIVNTFTL